MKFGKIATILFLLIAATPALGDWPVPAMNRMIDETNFVVNRGCSGTLIDTKDRYVLTASHCVESQYTTVEVEVEDEKGVLKKERRRRLLDGTVSQLTHDGPESITTVTHKVRLVKVDRERDLALLQIRAAIPNAQAASLACMSPVRGEKVYIVGNPMGNLYSSVVEGIVSSIQRETTMLGVDDHKQPLMQISGGVVGGNSGGAVYDGAGRLVGVPVLAYRVNEVLGFAVPLNSIKQFLADVKVNVECAW